MMFVKICGITRVPDALAAAEYGASAIGLNFYPRSKRCVTRNAAAEICRALPLGVLRVGLFVNASADEINDLDADLQFDLIQLHGDETPEFCAQWGERVVRAIRLATAADLERVEHYPTVRHIMVDASVKNAYGGTGVTCDWSLAAQAVTRTEQPVILAGGLTPENVAAAIRRVQPQGVDVAGGVESAPGVKDAQKMQAFIAAARARG
jgi:phosphoribosylanthranilate isomerase